MPKLLFYRQERVDGGIRTGLELDEQTLAEDFQEGSSDTDPILLWYVDVKCEGPQVPGNPDAAEDWFIKHSPVLREYVKEYAQKIQTGLDEGFFSIEWNMQPKIAENIGVRVSCSASTRVLARNLSEKLQEVESQWDDILSHLGLVETTGS